MLRFSSFLQPVQEAIQQRPVSLAALKATFRSADSARTTAWLLPDGTRLRKDDPNEEHVTELNLKGFKWYETMRLGVIRYTSIGFETYGPITPTQAQIIVDDHTGKTDEDWSTLYVDVADGQDYLQSRVYTEPVSASALRAWVNSHVPPVHEARYILMSVKDSGIVHDLSESVKYNSPKDLIAALRAKYPKTDSRYDGWFILPDGTRLDAAEEATHMDAAEAIGVDLADVLRAGVIRSKADDGIEIGRALTNEQARVIYDDFQFYYKRGLNVDVFYMEQGDWKVRQWKALHIPLPDDRISETALRNRINNFAKQYLHEAVLLEANWMYHGSPVHVIGPLRAGTETHAPIDRAIGVHFAADVEISKKFARGLYRQSTEGVLYRTEAPPRSKCLIVPQRSYYTKHKFGEVEKFISKSSDQSGIGSFVIGTVLEDHPDLFIAWLMRRNMMPKDQAAIAYQRLKQHQAPMLDKYDYFNSFRSYVSNLDSTGLMFHDDERAEIVRLFNDIMKAQGVDALVYQNTAPMEIDHGPVKVRSPKCYILLNHAIDRYPLEEVAVPLAASYDPLLEQTTTFTDKYDFEEALGDFTGTSYPDFLRSHGITFTTIHPVVGTGDLYAFTFKGTHYVLEDGDDHLTEANEWVNELVLPDQWIELPDFNKEFWQDPSPLYHATEKYNVELIQKQGLHPSNKSRGTYNRNVSSAVFTVSDVGRLEEGSYGEAIFEIDTAAMKRDGYEPPVGEEPAIEENRMRSALAWKIGLRDWESTEPDDGEWEETVIVYGGIAPKYLTLLD